MIKAICIAMLIATTCHAWQAHDLAPVARVRTRAAVSEPWTPADLDGLALWLDASDTSTLWNNLAATTNVSDGDFVWQWDDKANSAVYETISTSTNHPVYRTNPARVEYQSSLAGLAPILINTTRTLMSNGQTGYSAFVVAKSTSVSTSKSSFWAGTGANRNATFQHFGSEVYGYVGGNLAFAKKSYTSTNLQMTAWIYDGGEAAANRLRLYYNAADQDPLSVTGTIPTSLATAAAGVAIGGRDASLPSQPWRGDLHSIVFVNNTLSTSDRQKLEGYLAHKWGLAANLPSDHPYKSAAPTK